MIKITRTENRELVDLIERQDEEIKRMRDELNECRDRIENHERDSEFLKHLYENGYIDLNGNSIERDHMLSIGLY